MGVCGGCEFYICESNTVSGSKHFLKLMVSCFTSSISWFYDGSKILLHNKLNEKRSGATLTKAVKKLHLSMLAKPRD